MEESNRKYIIGPSKIHGRGIIATSIINKDEIIGVAILIQAQKVLITEDFGCFVNHSYTPNSCLVPDVNCYNLVAIRKILPGEEIVADYNETPYFLQKPKSHFI